MPKGRYITVRIQLLAIMATLVLALAAGDSYAQFGSRGGLGGMFGGSRGGRGSQSNNKDNANSRAAQQENDFFDQMQFRLALLEEDLHLQPEQRASWESFASRVRAYTGDLARERTRAMTSSQDRDAGGGGVQYIEQVADTARNRATALDDIAAAAKTLYASFTVDQRRLADVRMATIIASQPRAVPGPGSGSNLPDLGSSSSTQR